MTVALTRRNVASLPPPERGQADYFDERLPGLGLRVTAKGARSWFIWYRLGGRMRRFTIGPCHLLDLDAARDRARDLLLDARKGVDPAEARRAQKQADQEKAAGGDTFADLADVYLAYAAGKRSVGKDRRALLGDVLPTFGTRRARDVRPEHIEALVERIRERGAPSQARRTFGLVRRVYNVGLRKAQARVRFGLTANPCGGVESPGRDTDRDRVLSTEELRRLWCALEQEDAATAALIKLQLLSAQRPGEVRSMRREDVNVDTSTWVIPASRSKNGRSNVVPLSRSALEIVLTQLARHSSPWLFPGDGKDGCRTKTSHIVERLRRRADVANWRLHDLRRTAASKMAEAGVDRLTIKKLLNHSERGDVTAVYERYGRDAEKRAAVELWARRLHQIVTGEAAAKVVPLRSA